MQYAGFAQVEILSMLSLPLLADALELESIIGVKSEEAKMELDYVN